jgi:hypothetical protein
VQYPTKFNLIINLTTARAIGLTFPEIIPAPRRRGDRITVAFVAVQAQAV